MQMNIQSDPFHPFGLNIIVKWNNNSDSSGPTEWDIPIFFYFYFLQPSPCFPNLYTFRELGGVYDTGATFILVRA